MQRGPGRSRPYYCKGVNDDDVGNATKEGGGVFRQGMHMESRMAASLAWWKKEKIAEKLVVECLRTDCQVHELGPGERLMCSEILREGTLLD